MKKALILLFLPCFFLAEITSMVFNEKNELLVTSESEIKVFDEALNNIKNIRGSFNRPLQVAPAGAGFLALDTGNNCVKIFGSDGILTGQFKSYGNMNNEFNRPSGIAVASNGNIYVADTGNDRIKIFTGEGSYLGSFGKRGSGDGELLNPYHLALDKNDDLYVLDAGNQCIKKFSKDGKYILKTGAGLESLSDFTLDVAGNIYAADYKSRGIKIFDREGKFLRNFQAPEYFKEPVCVAAGKNNRLAVYDRGRGILEVFENNTPGLQKKLNNVNSWNWLGELFDLVINKNGELFATFSYKDYVMRFDNSGRATGDFGGSGEAPGLFGSPRGLALNSKEELLAVDLFNDRVQSIKFSDGEENSRVLCADLKRPMYVCTDKEDNIYVSDTVNAAVKKYTKDGKLIAEYKMDAYFNPGDICVDKEMNLYAVNTLNWQIIIYDQKNDKREYLDLGLKYPHSITVDGAKNIYVYEYFDGEIRKYQKTKLLEKHKIERIRGKRTLGALALYAGKLYFFDGSRLKTFDITP
ncbi:MAG: 6-bladed beta-propeller [Candidatus Firestonebacteria bacterium]